MVDGTQKSSIRNWPNCPFRGLPHVSLDDRCPDVLEVFIDSVSLGETYIPYEADEDAPKKRGRKQTRQIVEETTTMLIPVVTYGSYCQRCLGENIREKEAGRSGKTPRPSKKLDSKST